MSQKVASLYAEIGADTTKLEAGLKRTKDGLTGVKKGAADTIQSLTGFSVGSLTAAAALAGLASAAKKSIDAASDLDETLNKTKVVFGEAADEVIQFGESAARGMGMSKNAALGAAATFGNLFVSMGLAEDKSAEMSTSLVKLAGDLASFNNIDPTVALEKLRAGISGEAEPLRALGVNLTEAAVQARALEMGLAATAKELTVADKAQARYALILEQTATAQGDFARTSEGLANQQRILEAQLADTSAELGQNLLPAYLELVTVANDAAGAFNLLVAAGDKLNAATAEHEKNVRATATSYAEYQAEMARALEVQGKHVRITEDGIEVFRAFQGYIKVTGEEYGILTEKQWEGVQAAEDWGSAEREAALAAKYAADTASEMGEAVEESTGKVTNASRVMEDAATKADMMAEGFMKAVEHANAMAEASENLTEAQAALNDAQASWKEEIGGDLGSLLDGAKLSTDRYHDGLQAVDDVMGTSLLPAQELKEAQKKLVDEFARTGDVDAFKQGLQELQETFMPLNESIQKATELVDILQEKLNNLEGTYRATVKISTDGGGATASPAKQITPPSKGGPSATPAATGLDFRVPSGYPNDSYYLPLAVTSGEQVTVTPASEASAGKSGDTFNMYVYDITDWEAAAYRIAQIQKRRS